MRGIRAQPKHEVIRGVKRASDLESGRVLRCFPTREALRIANFRKRPFSQIRIEAWREKVIDYAFSASNPLMSYGRVDRRDLFPSQSLLDLLRGERPNQRG